MERERATRGLAVLAAVNVAYVAFGYVLTVATARLLGAAEYGEFGIVTGYVSVLAALVVKGVPAGAARLMASPGVDRDAAFAVGARLLGLSSVVVLLVSVALAVPTGIVLDDPALAPLLMVGASAALTFGANSMLLTYAMGTHDVPRQAWSQFVLSLARMLCVVGGAAAWGVTGAVVGYVAAPLLAALPLVRRVPLRVSSPGVDVAALRREVLVVSVGSIVSSAMITSLFVVDIFGLAVVASDRSVGVYVAYGTLAHVPYFLLQSSSAVLVPTIAAAPDEHALCRVVRDSTTDMFLLALLPTVVLVAVGDRLAPLLFGAGFDADGLVVAPLALATLAVTGQSVCIAVDVATGRLRGMIAIVLAAPVVVGGATTFGALEGGIQGAAIGACVGSLVPLCAHLAYQARRTGWPLEVARVVGPCIRAVTAGVVIALVPNDVVAVGLGVVVGCAWLVTMLRRRGTAAAVVAEPRPEPIP